jgi:hypothetical protein
VWSISPPENEVLIQAKEIHVSQIAIVPTTASLTLVPPKEVQLKFTKNLLKRGDIVWGVQYIVPWGIEMAEAEDDAW